MKLLYYFPAFGYLLAFIIILHYVFGVFPNYIDIPVFGGRVVDGVVKAYPINITDKNWYPTWGTFLILFALLLLFWELLKSVQPSDMVSMDHALSTVVFIIYFGFWLAKPWAGNSLFLTLTLMALLDVIAGFTISISAARRDLTVAG